MPEISCGKWEKKGLRNQEESFIGISGSSQGTEIPLVPWGQGWGWGRIQLKPLATRAQGQYRIEGQTE